MRVPNARATIAASVNCRNRDKELIAVTVILLLLRLSQKKILAVTRSRWLRRSESLQNASFLTDISSTVCFALESGYRWLAFLEEVWETGGFVLAKCVNVFQSKQNLNGNFVT